VNAFWLLLFMIGTATVWFRNIDAAGIVQTTELKSISFIILILLFIVLVIIQVIWLILNLVIGRNEKTQFQPYIDHPFNAMDASQ